MGDQRKHKRMPVNLSCSLRCEDDPSPVLATVLDVSFGGIGIVASRELHAGAIVEITHSDFPCVPTRNPTSKCRVVSVRPAKASINGIRIGLAFAPPDTEFIQNLLEWVQMQTLVQKIFQQRSHTSGPKPEQPKELIQQLEKEVDTLRDLIPICCSCKKVRTDKGYWQQIEEYVQNGSGAEFSHAICPECREKLYPALSAKK